MRKVIDDGDSLDSSNSLRWVPLPIDSTVIPGATAYISSRACGREPNGRRGGGGQPVEPRAGPRERRASRAHRAGARLGMMQFYF